MVLIEWTDHSRRRFESWRISIFYRKWLQNTANQWLPCFWLSSFDRYSRHNCYYVACFKGLLHRSIVASFSGRSARDQPRKPRGERGARALFRLLALLPLLAGSSRALPFPSWGPP